MLHVKPAYGLAKSIAISRILANQHLTFDVLVGPAIGLLSPRRYTTGLKGDVFSSRPSIGADLPALWPQNNGDDVFRFVPLFS